MPSIKSYPKGNYLAHSVQFPSHEGKWPRFKTRLNIHYQVQAVSSEEG